MPLQALPKSICTKNPPPSDKEILFHLRFCVNTFLRIYANICQSQLLRLDESLPELEHESPPDQLLS